MAPPGGHRGHLGPKRQYEADLARSALAAAHTVATILREEGFDERTIADALGQKTESMARHYARDADLSRKMAGVAEGLEEAENRRRTKVVKPA